MNVGKKLADNTQRGTAQSVFIDPAWLVTAHSRGKTHLRTAAQRMGWDVAHRCLLPARKEAQFAPCLPRAPALARVWSTRAEYVGLTSQPQNGNHRAGHGTWHPGSHQNIFRDSRGSLGRPGTRSTLLGFDPGCQVPC